MPLKLFLVSACSSLLLVACQNQNTKPIQELDATTATAQLEEFERSAWRGCDLGIETGQREAEMLDGTAGLPFTMCKGVFENSYPYEFVLIHNPENEKQLLSSQLEYRRGHQETFNAMLRYFLRLQGVEDEAERLKIRSQVTSIIASNPRSREFTPIMFLADGRQIELAHNYPKMAFSTLRVRNQK